MRLLHCVRNDMLLHCVRNDPLHRHCEEPLATKQSHPSAYDYKIATLTFSSIISLAILSVNRSTLSISENFLIFPLRFSTSRR